MTAVGWGVTFILIFVAIFVFIWASPLLIALFIVITNAIATKIGCAVFLIDLALTLLGGLLFWKCQGPLGGMGLFLLVIGPLALIVLYRIGGEPFNQRP